MKLSDLENKEFLYVLKAFLECIEKNDEDGAYIALNVMKTKKMKKKIALR